MDEVLRREIDRFVEENTETIKRDIGRLVAVNSVEGEPEEGAPFGRGPREALTLGLQIAQGLGLKAVRWARATSTLPPSPIWTLCRWARVGRATRSPCASARGGSSAAA